MDNVNETKHITKTRTGDKEAVPCHGSIYDYDKHMRGIDSFDTLLA
jgi:hypothetical protein